MRLLKDSESEGFPRILKDSVEREMRRTVESGPRLPLGKGGGAPLRGVPVLAGRGTREPLGWAPDEAPWSPFGKGARLFACEGSRTSCAFVVSPSACRRASRAPRGGSPQIAHDVYAHCVVCHDSCPYGFQCMYMRKVHQYEY